jgi:RNA polymerase sigma-70 factor
MELIDSSRSLDEAEVPAHLLRVIEKLWKSSDAQVLNIDQDCFNQLLLRIGESNNYGCNKDETPSKREQAQFLEKLHLDDLVLAQACVRGNELAWERFISHYREPLRKLAFGIAGQDVLGQDCAGSIFADLYGLGEKGDLRPPPLNAYEGRSSLKTWLCSVLSRKYQNLRRKHSRETELDETMDLPAPPTRCDIFDLSPERKALLQGTIEQVLRGLTTDERFLLKTRYLDGWTVYDLGRLLRKHPGNISRQLSKLAERLKRFTRRSLLMAGLSSAQIDETMRFDILELDVQAKEILQQFGGQSFKRDGGMRDREGGTDED